MGITWALDGRGEPREPAHLYKGESVYGWQQGVWVCVGGLGPREAGPQRLAGVRSLWWSHAWLLPRPRKPPLPRVQIRGQAGTFEENSTTHGGWCQPRGWAEGRASVWEQVLICYGWGRGEGPVDG